MLESKRNLYFDRKTRRPVQVTTDDSHHDHLGSTQSPNIYSSSPSKSPQFPPEERKHESQSLQQKEAKEIPTPIETKVDRDRDDPTEINSSKPNNVFTLREFVVHSALNVPTLLIGKYEKIDLEPTDKLYLPSLKTISWHAEKDESMFTNFSNSLSDTPPEDADEMPPKKRWALYKILKAAPNLIEIKDFNIDTDFGIVMAAGKLDTIQELTIFETVDVNTLEKLIEVNTQLNIKTLSLMTTTTPITSSADLLDFHKRQKLSWTIQKLFQVISDSLRTLKLSAQFSSFLDLQIPMELPKLYQLILGENVSNFRTTKFPFCTPTRLLPRQIDLEKTFPNLQILDLSRLQTHWNSYWDQYFPHGTAIPKGTFGSVKVLILSSRCSQFFMEKIHKLCPNFVKLVILTGLGVAGVGIDCCEQGHVLDYMMISIFRFWRHLQYLEIRINFDDPSMICTPNLNLDSAFTGLRSDICQRLARFGVGKCRQFCEEVIGMENMQKFSPLVRPSITEMIYLKTLKITLSHKCLGKLVCQLEKNFKDFTSTTPISFVSGRYGFSLMPSLRVDLVFDHQCPWGQEMLKQFEGLKLYVNLRHKQDKRFEHLWYTF